MKNFFVKIGNGVKKMFTNVGVVFKRLFNKKYMQYSFQKYRSFTAIQAREQFDKVVAKNAKDKIRIIVTNVVKFFVIFAVSFLVFFILNALGIVAQSNFFDLFNLLVFVMFVIQTIASMVSCTKNYFIAEDNKLLITFPSSGSSLFFSKLTVEFLRELLSNAFMLYPILLGLIFVGTTLGFYPFQMISLLWVVFPLLCLIAIEVLLGSLLSIIWLLFLRLTKRVPLIELFLFVAAIVVGFVGAIWIINLIPTKLVVFEVWMDIKANISNFLTNFTKTIIPGTLFTRIVLGFQDLSYIGFRLNGTSFLYFAILVGIVIALFILVYIIIKPLFLYMMTKSTDYEKVTEDAKKENKVHSIKTTFLFKELKVTLRTIESSGAYLLTYTIVPILIYLLCRIFGAIDTSLKGDVLSTTFCVLLISLPILASNSTIASLYSKEGRAGYMKKTKPVNIVFPLFSKLIFNLVLSVLSIIVSIVIVSIYSKVGVGTTIIIGISIIFLQVAHVLFSSTLDVTRPKNEAYATDGDGVRNPNETLSTIVAFIFSALFAFLTYFLLNEAITRQFAFINAAIRILVLSIVILLSAGYLYFAKIKAYFMER